MIAEALPQDKVGVVKRLQSEARTVAMMAMVAGAAMAFSSVFVVTNSLRLRPFK